jgi:hypothetical protein
LVTIAAVALAGQPAATLAAAPVIDAVVVDETSNTITIMGEQFPVAPGSLVVKLGQIGDITAKCQGTRGIRVQWVRLAYKARRDQRVRKGLKELQVLLAHKAPGASQPEYSY